MPAKSGIHDLLASTDIKAKQALLFLKKKKQKNFHLPWALAHSRHSPQESKVFCFAAGVGFFLKKKPLLPSLQSA